MRLAICALLFAAGLAAGTGFQSARAVWPKGLEKDRNLFVGFRAAFDAPPDRRAVLRITGSTLYRFFVNGEFGGYGPARGPHGYYRVDEWDLARRLKAGRNVVAVEVAGYNVNSYYTLDQPSFLQAEVVASDRVLASTGGLHRPFEAALLKERVKKVQRYSFQRPFIEVYRLAQGWDRWRVDGEAAFGLVELATVPPVRLLPRRMPYPDFAMRQPEASVSVGRLRTGIAAAKLWKDRALTQIGPKLGGYQEAELETIPSLDLQRIATEPGERPGQGYSWSGSHALGEKTYDILDFGTNLSGFIGAIVTCRRAGRLYLTFDEILTRGDVDFKRLGCVNAVTYELQPGVYRLESFEPYTLRYLKFMAAEGAFEVSEVCLREYANPNVWGAQFASSDERLNRLFAAGRETYRQNAVDLFTDCPHRERAGWLCDSFFTSRVARVLNGDTVMEHAFFENYLLPESFANMPKGMLPMCYPADHYDGVFIPNWALWFVVQLEEYLARSGDRETVDALRPKVTGVFDYFKRFRNSSGLLENLENWVFIEWSDANKFVSGVNYPSNMLYSAAMASAGRLYKDPAMLAEADRLRRVIGQQSFDGEFFVDNAVRENGVLRPTHNRTEVCQYFAFYFDVANRENHGKLWSRLEKEFGPRRHETGAYPDVRPANAFVGNYLRLELLSRFGMVRQLLDESASYLLYMADRTGTLWENDGPYASCNHGFASHAVYSLFRDVLGVVQVDTRARIIRVRIGDSGLDWCEGRIPAENGFVSLRWKRHGTRVVYKLDVPAAYTVKVEGAVGVELTPEM